MEIAHLKNGGLQDQVLPFTGVPHWTWSTIRGITGGLATGTSVRTALVMCVALQALRNTDVDHIGDQVVKAGFSQPRLIFT